MTVQLAGWAQHPWIGFDTESTGVDVESARIVTAALVGITPGSKPTSWYRLINPGVPIPSEGSDIHGITDEKAQAEGEEPAVVLDLLAGHLENALLSGRAIVGMNVPYDISLLDRECTRHGVETLSSRLGGYLAIRPVIDVYVLDKHVDPYRKGKRNLTALCQRYGVTIGGAHDAHEDVLAAARVAWRIAQLAARPVEWLTSVYGLKRPDAERLAGLNGLTLDDLHNLQIKAKKKQADSFRNHLKRQNKPYDDVSADWPLIPTSIAA
ncbi:exonuclease domain-containing protein [Nonomuraea basaltis]|uniref:exonuclease domain-containing protein n=1 Tax=Nonomuraea basaltis TaxID=2495887 RepID=UPI00148652E7|nr:exonuclease domain-containing protein [Nonomuraea basaltis]